MTDQKISRRFFITIFVSFALIFFAPLLCQANNEIFWWQMDEYKKVAEEFDIEVKDSPQLEKNAQGALQKDNIFSWQMNEYKKLQGTSDFPETGDPNPQLETTSQKSQEENKIYPWQMEEYQKIQESFTKEDLNSTHIKKSDKSSADIIFGH